MKPDLILSAIIVTMLAYASFRILDTVMQPIEPICEKEGSPIPCTSDEKGQGSDG